MEFDLENHLSYFPHSAVMMKEGRVYGVWMIGNNYKRVHGYYGEYPPRYRDRVVSLLKLDGGYNKTLHLFSGSIQASLHHIITFDINPELKPNVVGDAEHLTDYFDMNTFSLVLADPPYSSQDAQKYGFKMPNKAKVLRELYEIVIPGGLVVWLDTRRPMYRKDQWDLAGLILLDCGTNRVARSVTFLRAK